MEKLMQFIEKNLSPIAYKISSQRHMRAIRAGIIATLPLTIVGSFFTILLNLPIESLANAIAPYSAIINIPFRYTVGLIAMFSAYGIGAHLAGSYKMSELNGGLLSVVAFLIIAVVPVHVTESIDGVIAAGRYMNIASFGASSLFGAILASLASVEILHLFEAKNLTLKMPEGVPPEVANSFSALYPAAAVIILFLVIRHILGIDINSILGMMLMPLKNILAGNSLIGGLITSFLIHGFWALGIHGPAIMGPVIRPIWDMTIAENMDMFVAGAAASELPNIFTEQFFQWFVHQGGAGCTLALTILFLFSKSKYLKSLGRLSFVPGLFNINEPMIFGAPIVMNPILAIPFIVAPLVLTVISYIFTQLGLVPMMMARLPFTIPAPIAAVMSTDWNWMSGVLVILNLVIALLIYYPFFKLLEKQQLEKEANTVEEVEEDDIDLDTFTLD